jgi:hypothetical protein
MARRRLEPLNSFAEWIRTSTRSRTRLQRGRRGIQPGTRHRRCSRDRSQRQRGQRARGGLRRHIGVAIHKPGTCTRTSRRAPHGRVEVDVFDVLDSVEAEGPVVDNLADGVADAVVVGVLVVLQPGRGDRLTPQRVHQMRGEPVVLQQLHQPPPAERGLERGGRARRQAADHPQHRLCPVGHVAVGEHFAILIDHRHLGPLAVHVDPDVHSIEGLLPELACHPGALLHRAEQGRGSGLTPGPHRVRSAHV